MEGVMSAYHNEPHNRCNCVKRYKRKLSESNVQVLTQIVSIKHKTTAAQLTAELNAQPGLIVNLFPLKTFIRRSTHGWAATAW